MAGDLSTKLGGEPAGKGEAKVRLTKMIGLVAVAALAAMAFVGASSASANGPTSLCKVDQLVCAEANLIKAVHDIDPEALLLSSILDVECEALFHGTVLAPYLAKPLHILGNFLYSNCNEGECEAKEPGASPTSLLTILKTGVEKATVTGTGEVLVKCGSFLHCVYNGTGLVGEGLGALLSGPNGVTQTHEATVNKVSGFLCPSTGKLDTLYRPLIPTYISE
jgi:hypothetical protein